MSTLEQVKSPAARAADRTPTGVRAWWPNTRTFLVEVRNEMRRVTWPSRKEVYATTLVVILTSAFFGVYLWGLDLMLNAAVNWVLRSFGAA